jgi:hypothetical protein
MSDWDQEKDRFRCTTCGERASSLSALRNHYFKCWRKIHLHDDLSDAELRQRIENHLNQETFDIFGGHKYSASKGREAISREEKSGKMSRYYRMFNPDEIVMPYGKKVRKRKARAKKRKTKAGKRKRAYGSR